MTDARRKRTPSKARPVGIRITPSAQAAINGVAEKIKRAIADGIRRSANTTAHAMHLASENRRLIEKIHNLEAERLIQDRLIKQLQARPEAAR